MSLLIFNYIIAIFFFAYSYYLDSYTDADKYSNNTTNMSVIIAIGVLLIGLSVHVVYYENLRLSTVLFRFSIICFAYTSYLLLKEAFSAPYYGKSKGIAFFGVVLMVAAFILSFLSVRTVSLIEVVRDGAGSKYTVKINSMDIFPGMTVFTVFAGFYFVVLPLFSFLVMFFRGIAMRSRIYRQRLLFMALVLLAGLGISAGLAFLSIRYIWAFSLIPLGLAFIHIAFNSIREITTIVDRSIFMAGLVNFICIWLLFSVLAAFGIWISYKFLPHGVLLFLLFTVIFVVLVYLREIVSDFFSRIFRIGTDYESDLEREIEGIEFTGGREEILKHLEGVLEKYIDCSRFDVLMSDDRGCLKTIYSNHGKNVSFDFEDNNAIRFLLVQNESVVLKTQAVSKHLFSDVKSELLAIFDLTGADAFLLLREGPRIVGMLMFGPKKRAADYSDYDYSSFTRLYSNFFLIMYYLKNIANESVVLTVDREIEFSGQVIAGIQENVDRIRNPKVDYNFITKSARKLGGDFIDFVKLGGEKYLFVMGDVSGKGLTASMSMVIMKSVLRTFLNETSDFKQLVIKMNSFVRDNLPKGTFFAGVFGIFDFKQNILFYVNCGIPAMFLYTAGYNNAIEIQGEGHVLGFVRNISPYLRVKKINLNPGDIILVTTDGLINSLSLRGERYGKTRLQKQLLDNRTYTADRVAKFICEDVDAFVSSETEDDITILVFKYLSGQES